MLSKVLNPFMLFYLMFSIVLCVLMVTLINEKKNLKFGKREKEVICSKLLSHIVSSAGVLMLGRQAQKPMDSNSALQRLCFKLDDVQQGQPLSSTLVWSPV